MNGLMALPDASSPLAWILGIPLAASVLLALLRSGSDARAFVSAVLTPVAHRTAQITSMIFLILIGATVFGYYMTLSRIPQTVVILVTEMKLNRWVVIIGIVVAYFVISMFMDEIPLLLLTLQLTFPLITSLGFDPVWFGVLSMMMVAMGLVFPPVGLLAFVVSATANVNLMKVYKGCSILMLAIVATTVLLMIFPQMALWLPATMR